MGLRRIAAGTKVFLQTLLLAVLFLPLFKMPSLAGDKDKQLKQSPNFTDSPTYGDVIGLQPGFEKILHGKLRPAAGEATEPIKKPAKTEAKSLSTPAPTKPPITPARVRKAAVRTSPPPVLVPQPQFVQEVDAPPIPPPPNISVTALSRPAALLSKADRADMKQRRKEIAAHRTFAKTQLRQARGLSVAALPRDRNALAAIEAARPTLNGLTASVDQDLAAPPRQEVPNITLAALDRPTSIAPPASDDDDVERRPTALPQVIAANLVPRPALDAPSVLSPADFNVLPIASEPLPPAASERVSQTVDRSDWNRLLAQTSAPPAVAAIVTPSPAPTQPPKIDASPEIAAVDVLTRNEALAVIDMVGLPGESQLIAGSNEDRSAIVASVQTTSTEYEPRPIGLGGLETLRDAVEHAVATNPDIKIAEAQEEDAFYAIREARAGFLPKVDLNAGAGPEVSRQRGDEEITRVRREVNATLRQTVFDFGLTQYDYRRAKQSYEAAKLKTLQSVEELTYDVTVAYLGVLQQQKVVNLAQQNLEAHRYILNLVTAQKEAGQGTAADVNRVSSSLSNAESFMLEEESKLQQSRDQYRRLLDAPPGLLVDPIIDLSLLPQTAEDAAARSVKESPQLLQVKADERSIKNQLRSQRGNYLPKVEMEVQGNLRTDVAGETGSIRDARAMMFLRYNVFNGGADTAVASRLRARVKEIGYEFEKQKRTVEQDIRNDFTAIDASRAKIETISDQVDAAQEVVRLYEEQFRAGDRTAFDLLDAQQALINAKLEQVLNKYQETRAAYRVLQQLGSLYYALTSQD